MDNSDMLANLDRDLHVIYWNIINNSEEIAWAKLRLRKTAKYNRSIPRVFILTRRRRKVEEVEFATYIVDLEAERRDRRLEMERLWRENKELEYEMAVEAGPWC